MKQLIVSTKKSLYIIYRSIWRVGTKMPTSRFLPAFEKLRRANGAFIAAPHPHYEACWTRDQLYCTLAYFYTGDTQKFKEGVWVVFDMFRTHRLKIEEIVRMRDEKVHDQKKMLSNVLHAKVHPDTFEEITHEWGHHQLDAIGLFLYIVGFAYQEGIDVRRDEDDARTLALLVHYLEAVRYWEFPDFGMWEEHLTLHASSIGAVVAGLTLIDEHKLAYVPLDLILKGQKMLYWLLPNESPEHDVDMAELSLIWPYNIMLPPVRSTVLALVEKKLVQKKGLNRYWGDEYYRSDDGISGEWPMGFFWLSIIYSECAREKNIRKGTKKEVGRLKKRARYWFDRGLKTLTSENYIPEIYKNGVPNEHTPLAWAHAMALIAEKKLSESR